MIRIVLALGITVASVSCSLAADDQDAVVAVLRSTWDRPDAPLQIGPVVVSGDHAVSGWMQGDMGGRALLRRKGNHWQVWLCSGDALKEASTLARTGIPNEQAKRLALAIAVAEAALPDQTLATLARFEGEVLVAGDPAHGAHNAGHSAHK